MITHIFTIGQRNCGKSEFIEKKINSFSHKLYIGTLWKSRSFDKIITRHAERRDESWQLYEITGNISWDLKQIDNMIKNLRLPNACLIDGLFTWAENISGFRKDRLHSSIDNIIGTIEYLVLNNPETKWYFIDVYPIVLKSEQRELEAIVCKQIHEQLVTRIEPIKIIDWENNI
jgi:adenosyl cobinamide kinase/adenosyl cobinamide phosphate guanylyltransferase